MGGHPYHFRDVGIYYYCKRTGGVHMGEAVAGYGYGSGFALIVVLFILLIIVGASCFC